MTLVDYKSAGSSITGEYIKQISVYIEENRKGKLATGVLWHNNAPVHKSRFPQAAVRESKFE